MIPCIVIEALNSCKASFSKLVRGFKGFASIFSTAMSEIEPTMAEFPEDVMSVSVFSNKALKPFPSAERFFVLELIANFYFFVFIRNFCQIVLLQELTRHVQIIDRTLTGSVMHDNCFAKTRCFSQFRVAVNNGIKNDFLKVHFHFVNNLIGQTQTRIVHGEKNTLNFQILIETTLNDFDGV